MTSILEDKLVHLQVETEKSVDTLIEGSNEHLDLILRITNPLNRISAEFEEVNEMLISSLDNISDDILRNEILPKMRAVNRSSAGLIGSIRSCFLYRDVRYALKRYIKQYDTLREIMHDIQNIRLVQDQEFDDLLGSITGR